MNNDSFKGTLIMTALLLLVVVLTRCMSIAKASPCEKVTTIGGVVVIGERICKDEREKQSDSTPHQ